ncbi:hypothetical protein H920_02584 [Fukomys damarensis]|uniref:Uncharacterized protein n=1 Tax=Fukomys damarensis TaxID=885580 RepID=A0A091EKC6_FUKDA|nr:hypothetical protein H920_02584 [Fukomys damarensis]
MTESTSISVPFTTSEQALQIEGASCSHEWEKTVRPHSSRKTAVQPKTAVLFHPASLMLPSDRLGSRIPGEADTNLLPLTSWPSSDPKIRMDPEEKSVSQSMDLSLYILLCCWILGCWY